jgi:hypothetical protein
VRIKSLGQTNSAAVSKKIPSKIFFDKSAKNRPFHSPQSGFKTRLKRVSIFCQVSQKLGGLAG